jgi:hypothetical protein
MKAMPNLETLYTELKRLVQIANFEGFETRKLAEQIRRELPTNLEHINVNNVLHIKAVALISEIWDYYGMFAAAREVSAIAPRILSLETPPRRPLPKDELSQSKIRLMVAYARRLYRAPEKTLVIDILLGCRQYIVSVRPTQVRDGEPGSYPRFSGAVELG